jgi:hypothetical protein
MKRYFVCDVCGNPIENMSEFLLQWKHCTRTVKSFECKIVHVRCQLKPVNGCITCEREFSELNTKTKILNWMDTLCKLCLNEHASFLTCLKRLLNTGDLKL